MLIRRGAIDSTPAGMKQPLHTSQEYLAVRSVLLCSILYLALQLEAAGFMKSRLITASCYTSVNRFQICITCAAWSLVLAALNG